MSRKAENAVKPTKEALQALKTLTRFLEDNACSMLRLTSRGFVSFHQPAAEGPTTWSPVYQDTEMLRMQAGEKTPWRHGVRCPVCKQWVDDNDNWAGDKCLRCALAEEQKQGGD